MSDVRADDLKMGDLRMSDLKKSNLKTSDPTAGGLVDPALQRKRHSEGKEPWHG